MSLLFDKPIMKFQKQEFLHDPDNGIKGDCWRTTIACLLGLDRSEVPHSHGEWGELVELMSNFLDSRGLQVIAIDLPGHLTVTEALAIGSSFCTQPFMFCGKSALGTGHVVIAHEGEIIHDPSRVDSGIVAPYEEHPANGEPYYRVEWLVHFPSRLPPVLLDPADEADELFFVCMTCGYEDHPDKFGRFCPKCGTDLEEDE